MFSLSAHYLCNARLTPHPRPLPQPSHPPASMIRIWVFARRTAVAFRCWSVAAEHSRGSIVQPRAWVVRFFFVESFVCWTFRQSDGLHQGLAAAERPIKATSGAACEYHTFSYCAFHLCNSRPTGTCPPSTHQS